MYGSPDIYQQRDKQKEISCKENSITLIRIPYWWDQSRDSLAATIHKYRPDLVA